MAKREVGSYSVSSCPVFVAKAKGIGKKKLDLRGKPPPSVNVRRRPLTQAEKTSEPVLHPCAGVP